MEPSSDTHVSSASPDLRPAEDMEVDSQTLSGAVDYTSNNLAAAIGDKSSTDDAKEAVNACVHSQETCPSSTGENENDNCSGEAEECDDASEISDFSDFSQESWQPVQGPIAWVQEQMRQGHSPRKILQDLVPSGTVIPEGLDPIMLWKIIINIVSEPPKRKKLNDINTLDDVLQLLNTSKKIIVLTGAGVSVSCGIPDFRSRDGVYARLAKDFPNLPDPQAMFDIHFFRSDPRPFFKFAKEIYPGQFKPSLCHRFIHLLEEKGKLLRNYTQNIDTLEQVAGIQRVVQCHGSFATATCAVCGHKVGSDAIQEDIFNQVIPHCPKCLPADHSAVMKPDIVFFGESLPEHFHNQMAADRDECDLLIVIGSSLKVRPVALIPNSLPAKVPQILINRERLHYFNFDVELLGNCDDIVGELCQRLGPGWEDLATSRPPLTEILMSDLPTPPASPVSGEPLSRVGGVCNPTVSSSNSSTVSRGSTPVSSFVSKECPYQKVSIIETSENCAGSTGALNSHEDGSGNIQKVSTSQSEPNCNKARRGHHHYTQSRKRPHPEPDIEAGVCSSEGEESLISVCHKGDSSIISSNNSSHESQEVHCQQQPHDSTKFHTHRHCQDQSSVRCMSPDLELRCQSSTNDHPVTSSLARPGSGNETSTRHKITAPQTEAEQLVHASGKADQKPAPRVTSCAHADSQDKDIYPESKKPRLNVGEEQSQEDSGQTAVRQSQPQEDSGQTVVRQSQPQEDSGQTVVRQSQPQEDSGQTVVRQSQPQEDSGQTVVRQSQPQEDSGQTVVRQSQPQEDSGQTVVRQSQPQEDSGQTVVKQSLPQEDSGQTVVKQSQPQEDSGQTVVKQSQPQEDSGQTVVKQSQPQEDSGQTVVKQSDNRAGTCMESSNNCGSHMKDTLQDIHRAWHNRFRVSLAEHLSDREVLFLPPSRYVFKGAEVFWESESEDCDGDSCSEDGGYDDDDDSSYEDGSSVDSCAERAPEDVMSSEESRPDDMQDVSAAQRTNDTQDISATQRADDTQDISAAQRADDTQDISAAQRADDTKDISAAQRADDTQDISAAQRTDDKKLEEYMPDNKQQKELTPSLCGKDSIEKSTTLLPAQCTPATQVTCCDVSEENDQLCECSSSFNFLATQNKENDGSASSSASSVKDIHSDEAAQATVDSLILQYQD